MNRRRFLKGSLATLGLGGLQAILRPASALGQAATSRRFVSIQLSGAPPRWMYDFFPVAYGQEGFNLGGNLSLATNYASSNGRYVRPDFSTVSVKGLNAPPFWQLEVPAAGGGRRRVDGLLDNLLSLQGVNTSVDGHETCQRLHWQPVAGVQSRAALAADASESPLSAVSMQTVSFSFQSTRDKSFVPVNEITDDPLAQLLRPFLATIPGVAADRQAAFAAAAQTLDGSATQWAAAAAETRASQDAAFSLFARGFGDLEAIYAQRLAVYQDLIARSLSATLPGFSDLPVGAEGSRDQTYAFEGGEYVQTPDLRSLFGPETNVPGLAEQFVVVEYLLKEDLSRSLAIGSSPIQNLGDYGEQNFDEHATGVMVSLLNNAKYFTALSACLLELIDQLKAANLFDDTVIEVAGEFGRSPLPGGEGSDHGWPGKMSSFYSGRIQGPEIIGNIYSTPPADAGFEAYPGTWGYGAPVEGVQSTLNLNHEIATLATMLGVPSPTNAAPSLVTINGDGRIVRANGVERARIVRV